MYAGKEAVVLEFLADPVHLDAEIWDVTFLLYQIPTEFVPVADQGVEFVTECSLNIYWFERTLFRLGLFLLSLKSYSIMAHIFDVEGIAGSSQLDFAAVRVIWVRVCVTKFSALLHVLEHLDGLYSFWWSYNWHQTGIGSLHPLQLHYAGVVLTLVFTDEADFFCGVRTWEDLECSLLKLS